MTEKFYGSEGRHGRGPGRETGREGHMPGRMEMLRKVQEYNFMMIETGLFLNNQPCCEAAQTAYCDYRRKYLEALREYEECYGPLTYSGIDVKRDGWSWVHGPWPWEVEDC